MRLKEIHIQIQLTLYNSGLNCTGPLISVVNTAVLHDQQLVECAELRIRRADCKVICGLSTAWGISTPNPTPLLGCSKVNCADQGKD